MPWGYLAPRPDGLPQPRRSEAVSDEKPANPTPTFTPPPSPLQKETDRVARPGFRNPPNAKTKAQKSAKKK